MEFECDLLFLNGMLWKNKYLLQLRKIFEQIISRPYKVLIEFLTNEHELIGFEMHLTYHLSHLPTNSKYDTEISN